MRWDPLNDILRHREGGGGDVMYEILAYQVWLFGFMGTEQLGLVCGRAFYF